MVFQPEFHRVTNARPAGGRRTLCYVARKNGLTNKMGDNWDDSDDDWDNASDDLDAKLGLNKLSTEDDDAAPNFDDEEDIAVKEKERAAKASQAALKTKGNALKKKKELEEQRKMEEEVARQALEAEAEMEANMSTDERRALERQRVEEADNALTDDLFGGVDAKVQGGSGGGAMGAGDAVKLKDLKDHLMHAKKVSQCINGHGKTHLATAFLKECVQGCKDVLDDDAISDLIKVMNVIKNEKVQAQKRKVKGQAQKSKKQDKAATAKAQKIQNELFGDSNKYDEYDDMGAQYEDEYDGFF